MIRNPAKLREPSKKEGIISSTDSKSVCSQEVVTDLLPETQSLLNVPNGDLVAVKINGSNIQTNGQVSFQLHRPGMTDEHVEGPLTPAKGNVRMWNGKSGIRSLGDGVKSCQCC
ncbi:hypothetical protein TNCV_1157011 [Trichonephila clavipes]|nr:hypothetical protein TNCV_1157011 [Trichonephila clavipes]